MGIIIIITGPPIHSVGARLSLASVVVCNTAHMLSSSAKLHVVFNNVTAPNEQIFISRRQQNSFKAFYNILYYVTSRKCSTETLPHTPQFQQPLQFLLTHGAITLAFFSITANKEAITKQTGNSRVTRRKAQTA